MRNIWTIARREYKLYFISPVAYVVLFLFMIILGWFFYQNLGSAILQSYYQQSAPGVEIVISPLVTLILFTMPAITMRLIAEEQRTGTLELLLTAPVRDWEVIVGKWLGGFFFILSMLAITWVFPIVLNQLEKPGIDQGVLLSGYLGLAFMVASLIAIGVVISSLFTNQIAAFFVSLAVVLLLWFIRPPDSATGGVWNEILTNINFVDHYLNFYRGIIDLKDVFYYLSLTALGLFMGTVIIEARRWR
jgi:ABC-2 type transport system permease protein